MPKTPVAYIENPADYHDVIHIDSLVKNQIAALDTSLIDTSFLRITYRLGELEEYFLAYYNSKQKLEIAVNDKVRLGNIKGLQKQQKAISELLNISNKQLGIEQSISSTQEKLYQNTQNIYNENAGTQELFLQEKLKYLNQLRNEQNAYAGINNIHEQLSRVSTTLTAQEQEYEQTILLYRYEFVSKAYHLLTKIEEWKARYLLISPVGGRLVFLKEWRDNQFVMQGDEVATVIPDNEEYGCFGFIHPRSLAKMEAGQKVTISFDGYTTFEYGTITGELQHFNQVKNDSLVRVFIALPNGLTTTQNKQIRFVHELHGVGQIVTKEKSILFRLFEKIAKIFVKK